MIRCVPCRQTLSAEISVRSSQTSFISSTQKIYIFIIEKCICRVKVSKKPFILRWKKLHWTCICDGHHCSHGVFAQVALGTVHAYLIQVKQEGAQSLHATCLACLQPCPQGGAMPSYRPSAAQNTSADLSTIASSCALWLEVDILDAGMAPMLLFSK